MKSKTVILMVVAIACGLAASYMTSKVIAEKGNQTDVEKVSVLVARRNLSMGMLIHEPEKLFEDKQFLSGQEPKKAIRSLEELKDRRLNKPLSAEQFVTIDDLWDKDKDGLSGRMKQGMRAVGLNVNAQSMVGGFVLPHTHVDIVSVMTNASGETHSKIILQNVLVLAVDQSSNRPDDKQAVVASVVTVEVSPEQAERLSLAQKLGTISLILRSFGDDKVVTTRPVTPKDILLTGDKSDELAPEDAESVRSPRTPTWSPKVPDLPATPAGQPVEQKPVEPPPPPSKVHVMTIYNGEHGARHSFPLDGEGNAVTTNIEKSQPDQQNAPKTTTPPAAPKKP